mgnify:CR=1 FL=1
MSEQVSQERAGTPRGDGRGAAAVESQATRVTFFEDRAEVQRRARARVPAGVSFVEVEGVTALCDDPSLVAGIRGEAARVIAAKVWQAAASLAVRTTRAKSRESLEGCTVVAPLPTRQPSSPHLPPEFPMPPHSSMLWRRAG